MPKTEAAKKGLARYELLKNEKRTWLPMWQLVSEYVFMRRQSFTRAMSPGVFLNGNVFDGTAPWCAHRAAAAMAGALFPSAKRAVKLTAPEMMPDEIKCKKAVREYFRRANKVLHRTFDNPKSGWATTHSEYMLDEITFGVSGIYVQENDSNSVPVSFIAVDTKKLTIAEDATGKVDTVYIEKEMTVRQVIMEFGIEAVSPSLAAKLGKNFNERVKILHIIEPRVGAKESEGNIDMPVASIHIEMETEWELQQGGFASQPVKVGRYAKAMGEVYGRCPGIECMPDVLEINATREMLIIAEEKMLDPPIAVTSESATSVKINTSARAINVRSLSGRIPDSAGKWIEPIFTVGDIKPAKERVAEIKVSLKETFNLDILMDLLNETQQTLGEANIRDRKIGQALSTVFARQIAEVHTPVIERTVDILYGKGLLGVESDSDAALNAIAQGKTPFVIPDELRDWAKENDGEFYDIEYVSPAARIVRAEELTGMNHVITALETLAPFKPDIMDGIDEDKFLYNLVNLGGAPEDIVRDSETMANIRQAKNAANADAQKANVDHIKAQGARAQAQAAAELAKAGGLAQQGNNPLSLAG